ncbi:di-trans,poly-cis-decaprenylcistransferase [Microgenomates group bacterium RBG_16_45_19]|nr:MAG: di-trans,poly-cis-decaprenylcistransferase [Microgenomates group bacterium RBG_16_45_19]
MSKPPLQHVAIIMDGNRRWAKARNLPVAAGHKKVVAERVEELIERAATVGVGYITFWAFSTENWGREGREVKAIMQLFRWAFAHRAQRLVNKGARLRVIGDITRFDQDIQDKMKQYMEESEDNDKITVTFALNYGGRDEMVRAVNKLIHAGREITQDVFSQQLDTAGMPDPDLIIRTGGEMRLSGFMLWQAEYSELYLTQTLMPDFGARELDLALEEYGRRQRRRGK